MVLFASALHTTKSDNASVLTGFQQFCHSAAFFFFLIQFNSTMCFSDIFKIKKSVSAWAMLVSLWQPENFNIYRVFRMQREVGMEPWQGLPEGLISLVYLSWKIVQVWGTLPWPSCKAGPKWLHQEWILPKNYCLSGKIKDYISSSTTSQLNSTIFENQISKKNDFALNPT